MQGKWKPRSDAGSCYCCNPECGMDFPACDNTTCENRWFEWAKKQLKNPSQIL